LDGLGGYDEFISKDDSNFGNFCENRFIKKAIVGTLYADGEEMEDWATIKHGAEDVS
jgi:hypothetical protein